MQRRDFLKSAATTGLLPLLPGVAPEPKSPAVIDEQTKQRVRSRIRPITAEERLERQEKARRLMKESGIDALVFEGSVSLNYFTGVSWGRSERLFAMLLPQKGDPHYIAPKFEESRAQEQVGSVALSTWEEDESPYALLKKLFQDKGLLTGTIGVEETTRFFVTDNIGKEMSAAKLVSGSPVTAGCRSIKSAHEIELMQIANDITAEVFKTSLSSLRDGIKEREFAGVISKLFREFVYDPDGSKTRRDVSGGALVLFGEASAYPHGLEKEHVLREGDIVLIDGGCSVEGYNSDVTRTTTFGKPTEKLEKVWGIVRKAQDAALAAAKPGVPAEAIDAAARKVISDAGYGPDYRYFTHRLGHGIGMEGHEWYYLVRGNRRPLEPGNIFSDEPGIYIVGESFDPEVSDKKLKTEGFGIRLEDELLITENGSKLLLPQAESLEKIFG